ncbi:MAG: HAMP domain-containing histidine kinase [Treponema sp.]|jgi:signal transduction histidine kinase|nr:HAMP domain-containing histidine kinase [Treponema sp.]
MTIKRRFFISNIRMVMVTIGGLITGYLVTRLVLSAILQTWRIFEPSNFEAFRDTGLDSLAFLVSFTVFAAFICIINSILSYRMAKNITMPLDILSRGVKQIQENNFAYRIEYDGDDEFSPVCEAFNQMAAQLEDSTRRRIKDEANRRELLAGISHDLRTPLTTIKGYIEGLEAGVASTAEMQEKYFLAIKNKTASLEHIIERLFMFSKLDMDEFPLTPRRVNIMRAITDMIEELTEEYANRGLIITITGNLEHFVLIDAVFLRNALINILENSVMYKTKETGRMEINASLAGNSILIRFADDGPGVSPDALPKLFDVFYRADPSRHTKGSGLGLAISAKIVEHSGGNIYAENSGLNESGGGLAVVIRLPIENPPLASRPPTETEAN